MRVFLIFLLLFSAHPVWAKTSHEYFAEEDPGLGPLYGRNQMPLVSMFYVMPVARAQTLGKGKFLFRLQFDLTNVNEVGFLRGGNTLLVYDMEIYRTSFQFTYGILDNLDLHLEIPTIGTNGGFLDQFLFDYHDGLGFPLGDREKQPNGIHAFFLIQNGQVIYFFPQDDFGMGDINVDLKWQILKEKEDSWMPGLALRTGIKFPSGSFAEGQGSGEVDFAFGFAFSKGINRFHFFGGLDGIIIEDPAQLRSFIDGEIIHYFFGAEWALVHDYLSFILQFDGQTTPFSKTNLPQIDNEILDMVAGLKGTFYQRLFNWQFSFREDMIPDSTVDFTATFSLGASF